MAPTPRTPFRVHLTGFGPFRQYKENPSWMAVQPLDGVILDAPPRAPGESAEPAPAPKDHRTIALSSSLVPVTYTSALSLVPGLHDQGNDLIIHVGVGAGAMGGQPGRVVLERRARRFGYEKEDAEGRVADRNQKGERGFVGEEWDVGDELQTVLKRAEVVQFAQDRGLKCVGLSNDAGLYLCEFTFFASLAVARRNALRSGKPLIPVQFIHVPPLNEPYSASELTAAISLLVWSIVNEGGLEISAEA